MKDNDKTTVLRILNLTSKNIEIPRGFKHVKYRYQVYNDVKCKKKHLIFNGDNGGYELNGEVDGSLTSHEIPIPNSIDMVYVKERHYICRIEHSSLKVRIERNIYTMKKKEISKSDWIRMAVNMVTGEIVDTTSKHTSTVTHR